jgi:hypothetical protein
MKCIEAGQNIQLLIDDNLERRNEQQLKAHLAGCEACAQELETLKLMKGLLSIQPQILPKTEFDQRMLAAFKDQTIFEPKAEPNWLIALFAISKPAIAFALALFVLGCGLSFLFGRMSVSSFPQLTVSDTENKQTQPTTTQIKSPDISASEPAVNPEIKTVTKYVNVPLIKEKIVRQIVYVNGPHQNIIGSKSVKATASVNSARRQDMAKRLNLKDLQPIANVTYKIIRKGENNEE